MSNYLPGLNYIQDYCYTEVTSSPTQDTETARQLSIQIRVTTRAEYGRVLREIERILNVTAAPQGQSKQLSLPITTAEQLIGKEPSEEGKQVLAAVAAAVEAAPPSEPPAPWEPEESPETKTIVTTVSALEKTKAAIEAVLATPELNKAPDTEVTLVAEPAQSADTSPEDLAVSTFELSAGQVRTVEDAVGVWFDHAGLIKKLSDASKQRCSTTLSLALSNSLGVEPMEAQELIRAGVAKAQAAKKAVAAAKEAVVAKQVAAVSEKAESFLKALVADKQPSLGIAVKLACQALATSGEVSALEVEKFLCSLIGKHPALESEESITKITQTSKMKLYAGAAKVKLV